MKIVLYNLDFRFSNRYFIFPLFSFLLLVPKSKIYGSELKTYNQPVITDILPNSAQAGSIISVLGTDLGTILNVDFPSVFVNQVNATTSISVMGENLILVKIPSYIKSGLLTISGISQIAVSPISFNYLKKAQTIIGINEGTTALQFGAAAFTITGNNVENNVVINASSTPSQGVISIVGNTIKIIGIGSASITGSMAISPNYEAVNITSYLEIEPLPVTITSFNYSKIYGIENPPITGSILGAASLASVGVVFYTNATTLSSVGDYPILISFLGESASNYDITTIAGNITITKSNQTISFPSIPNYKLGNSVGYLSVFGIKSSSGLPVELEIKGKARLQSFEGEVAVLQIDSLGIVSISGSQSGNENFNAAPVVLRLLEITSSISDTNETIDTSKTLALTHFNIGERALAYPNPSNGNFHVDAAINSTIKIINTLGDVELIAVNKNPQPILIHNKGIYFLIISSGNSQRVAKVAIE